MREGQVSKPYLTEPENVKRFQVAYESRPGQENLADGRLLLRNWGSALHFIQFCEVWEASEPTIPINLPGKFMGMPRNKNPPVQ